MVEAAIAHHQATGSRKFLDIAIKYADCVCREVGPRQGQACVVPGHQIAEMALAKLYLATGDKKYLDEAKFFLDYRGKTTIVHDYSQAHKPVVDQDEAVGHAVRAAYMYAGMADVAALTGDTAYIHAIDRIWENIVAKKLYITGGIGATSSGEAFGKNYELPNMSAYCETCAAIGNVYVNHRLFRFIPSLPGYIYAVRDGAHAPVGALGLPAVYVNLFLSNSSTLDVDGKKLTLTQETNYPWDGDITIRVDKSSAGMFTMKIRIPGWLKNQPVPSDLYHYTDNRRLAASCSLNGTKIDVKPFEDGYLNLTRRWKKGDVIKLHFDMQPRTVRASSKVEADRGMISIERGPIVYCAEWADNDFDIMGTLVNQEPRFELGDATIANTPVKTIKTQAQTLSFSKDGRLEAKDATLTLIPYYAWCHRGSGKMSVWLAQDLNATTPTLPATLASQSKVETSSKIPALTSLNDRLTPRDENDRSVPYTHWWPKQASTEWITYEFPTVSTIQSSTVWWFDDGPWGGCRVPKSWNIYYRDEQGNWQPVAHPDHFGVKKGMGNTVNFDPVKTKALKLEVTLPDDNSAGIFEWSVK